MGTLQPSQLYLSMTLLRTVLAFSCAYIFISSVVGSYTPPDLYPEWNCPPEESSRICEGKLCTLSCSDGQEIEVALQCEEHHVALNEDNEYVCNPDPADTDGKFFLGPLKCLTPMVFVSGPLCALPVIG